MKKGDHKGRPAPGDRGLYDYCEFKDTYENTVTVRSSSSADGRRCWVFCKNKKGMDGTPSNHAEGGFVSASPHLSEEQAVRLATALMDFAGYKRTAKPRKGRARSKR